MSNTNKEKNSACWHAVDDAALVHMLTDQKIKGNWGDNNLKKVAWSACKTALAGSEKDSEGTPKTVTAIKNMAKGIPFKNHAIFDHIFMYKCTFSA